MSLKRFSARMGTSATAIPYATHTQHNHEIRSGGDMADNMCHAAAGTVSDSPTNDAGPGGGRSITRTPLGPPLSSVCRMATSRPAGVMERQLWICITLQAGVALAQPWLLELATRAFRCSLA